MKRTLLVLIVFILPVILIADIGNVKYSIPLTIDQPFGMALDNDLLLISDRSTGQLYQFSIKENKIIAEQPLPCRNPWGIAKDAAGLWISDRENNRILHYHMKKKRVDFVLTEVETDASGLAWDGESLWATSRNNFLELDPSDGTELQTFAGPGPDTTAIFFDGKYFWLSERYNDRIVCATTAGEIFGVLPAPGPYPAGICRQGDTLWVLDFEERKLYALDIAAQKKPFYLGEPHQREVHFTHELTNNGPSNDVIARLYVCVGQEGLHQKLLTPCVFSPVNITFIKDKWDQKFGVLQGNIPALKSLEIGYRVAIETRDLKYFILPEWVKPLDAIPPEVSKKYLVDGHKLKLNDPYIKKLVEKIVGDETNPFWIAFKIHKYLHLNMEYKMTGGWNAYQEAFRELWLFNTGNVSVFVKGWATFKIFSSCLARFTVYGVGGGIFILVLATYSLIRHKKIRLLDKTKVAFFSLWILPSFLFFLLIFIHPSNPGYVLVFMPALFILTALSINFISADLKEVTKKDLSVFIAFVVIIINLFMFFSSSYLTSYQEIRTHDRNLSIMLDGIKTYDPSKAAIFILPYSFYGYRHIMYYLPHYRVYQVDVRVAPTGEVRKTFWGQNKKTFLSETIILPERFDTFLMPLIANDRDKVSGIKDVSMKQLKPIDVYLAYGNISLIKDIYPELKIQ